MDLSVERTGETGSSVVELLIVLVIIGVLATMALVGVGDSRKQMLRMNLSRELKVNMERSRFDAIKRRVVTLSEMATITFNSSTRYTVKYDVNQNGILEAAEARVIDLGSRSSVTITGTNLTFPATLYFDENGNAVLRNASSTVITPMLTLCDAGCQAPLSATNATLLSISPTGTVAMLPGGATVPTFSAPTITQLTTGTDINPAIKVPLTIK